MATFFAIANGGFNNPAIWSLTPTGAGGAGIPTTGDVAVANSRTVTISADANCLWILNDTTGGATTGGSYTLAGGVTLAANISAANAICLNYNDLTPSTIAGNIIGGTGNIGAINNNIGVLNIIGNVTGGPGSNCHGVQNGSFGRIVINGNVSGGPGPGNAAGIQNVTGGTVIVNGNVTGGSGPGNDCIGVTGQGDVTINGTVSAGTRNGCIGVNYGGRFGSCTINGNVLAGPANGAGVRTAGATNIIINGNTFAGSNSAVPAEGVSHLGFGTVTINGDVFAGPGNAAVGANNTTSGILIVNGNAVGNGWGLGASNVAGPAVGVQGNQVGLTIVRSLCCGIRGQWPTGGNVYVFPRNNSTVTVKTSAFQDITLFSSASASAVPGTSDVRRGVIYYAGERTGTLSMPLANSVAQNQPVDNTVGTGLLLPTDVWNHGLSATTPSTIGDRLKDVATTSVATNLVSSFK